MYLKTKTIDIGMAGNGAIAGLVAITAPSGYVEYWAAPIIGAVAGVIVVFGVLAIEKVIDDPVGALSAHGLAGIWGTLSCGIFTSRAWPNSTKSAIRASGTAARFHQLGAQALGVGVAFGCVFVVSYAIFFADQEDDRAAGERRGRGRRPRHLRARDVRVPGAVHPAARVLDGPAPGGRASPRGTGPASRQPDDHRDPPRRSERMKKIEAFIRHEAFEPIRTELLDKGFPSLSIIEAKGSGRQKGIVEQYRGSTLTVNVRPKMKLEVVVEDKDKRIVVETILKHARTGEVGDGKIFVLPVEEAIRIRTGEDGEPVLQSHPEAEVAA